MKEARMYQAFFVPPAQDKSAGFLTAFSAKTLGFKNPFLL